MNILFSGAVLKHNWPGGEPAIARELFDFLSQRHSCTVSKSFHSIFYQHQYISRFITKDQFSLNNFLNFSNLSRNDAVLGFYDYDLSMVQQCIKKNIPIVATQHIYWGLCPKIDYWNNDFVCSCGKVEISKRDCKSCLSKQGFKWSYLVSELFSSKVINSLRLQRLSILSKCNAIVVPSNYMAMLYKKELKNYGQIRVIPNGVDTDLFKPSKKIVNPQKKRILYAGLKSYTKGYYHFLRLASSIKKMRNDVEFATFGWEKASLNSDVINLGYVNRSAIPQVYSSSYLLVFPSLWDEPFGLTPVESMACGCPVLAYASGGVSETIKSGDNGILVPKGDFNALREALLDLIDDESQNNKMRASSVLHIKENFSLSRMCKDYENLIMEFKAK